MPDRLRVLRAGLAAALLVLILLPAPGGPGASAAEAPPTQPPPTQPPPTQPPPTQTTSLPVPTSTGTPTPAAVAPDRRRNQPTPGPGGGTAPPVSVSPSTGFSVQHDRSPPLSSLARDEDVRTDDPAYRPRRPGRRDAEDAPGRDSSADAAGPGGRAASLDPLLQSRPGSQPLDGPILSFEGLGNRDNIAVAGGSVIPPDTVGDVGPRHYVQWVNVTLAIFSRSGERLLGPIPGNRIWRGLGGPCQRQNDGDPIVLYDHLADRWVLTQFALPNFPAGPFFQCVAVSQGPDPTGAYYRYAFQISANALNDYPKLSVWPDGYYYTYNAFEAGSLRTLGGAVGVLDRERMLAGQPAGIVLFDLWRDDSRYFGFLPADLDGPRPPAGAPGIFLSTDDDTFGWPNDRLTLFELRVRWGDRPSGQIVGPLVLPTAPFDSNLCGYDVSCIPQRGTNRRLDALADRAMYRLQYRNFGSHETLVVNLTVDVDRRDHAGIRWFELRRPRGGAWAIHQEGTYAPDEHHRWMASAAMDRLGNLAVGFSISGEDLFPGIRYVGRAPDDPLGTLPRRERTLVDGGGAQTTATSRWGDYSALVVDPRDDCTLFYTNEYYAATSERLWQTRIGAFRLPGCEDEASVGHVQDDDDKPRRLTEEQRQQRERTNRLGLDDERTEGNVIAVRCDAAIPTVVIANRDGDVEVRLIGDAATVCASIRVGEYLEVSGTKEHEGLFLADNVSGEW